MRPWRRFGVADISTGVLEPSWAWRLEKCIRFVVVTPGQSVSAEGLGKMKSQING